MVYAAARRVHGAPVRSRNAMNAVLTRWTLAMATASGLLSAGCSTNTDTGGILGGTTGHDAAAVGACLQAAPGCACATSGALATCTTYEQRSGNYTFCQQGTMTCENG